MRPRAYLLLFLLIPLLGVLLAGNASGATSRPDHEWGTPTGAHAGQPPRGVMLVIHGGSWQGGQPNIVQNLRPVADFYRLRGWATLNIDYRSGPSSIDDVVRFYDVARRRYGKRVPICASGQSAGGNLAMVLATIRPRLACVISEEGPATLMPLRDGHTAIPTISTILRGFTAAQARSMSPALHLGRYHGRILASLSTADTYIPGAVQARALRRASTTALVDVVMLPAATATDSEGFIHFSTTRPALQAWHGRQTRMLREIGRPR